MPGRPGRRKRSRPSGPIRKTVGAVLFDGRHAADLTQPQLCERSGVAVSSISAIENEKVTPQIGTLRLLGAVLGEEWLAEAVGALNGARGGGRGQ